MLRLGTHASWAGLITAAVLVSGCVRWGESDRNSSSYGDSYDDGGYESDDEGSYDTTGEDDTSPTDDVVDPPTRNRPTDDPPMGFEWPEPWPLDPDARVVVWGKTGIPTRNLRMFENFLVHLAAESDDGSDTGGSDSGGSDTGGSDTGGSDSGGADEELLMLWIDDCDPREDSAGCLAGNVQPFFERVDALGVIDFKPLSEVDPQAYDVIIADFCGPVSPEQVGQMLGDGAHVLVLGDQWCTFEGNVSADIANVLLEHIGTRFNGKELYNHDFFVADENQTGLLQDVAVVDAWGIAVQEIGPGFSEVLGTVDGASISVRE